MSPLRIEWTLDTPWCPPANPIHLDGLIAWAKVDRAIANGEAFEDYDEILCDLPFAKHETPTGWVWQASMLMPGKVSAVERRYLTSKTPVADILSSTGKAGEASVIEGGRATIDTQRDYFKPSALHYTLEYVDTITAWCVGDVDEIVELLGRIKTIGKKGRLGHGRIVGDAKVEIEDYAFEYWKRRLLPEAQDGYFPVNGRLRPPYWKGNDTGVVWRPLDLLVPSAA
jgi:CRISPR type IV-associated protein Csf3